MAELIHCSPPPSTSIITCVDPITGFSEKSKSFHSLRPDVPLPSDPTLSFTTFALSLLPSPLPSNPALIDATSSLAVSYPSLVSQLHSLSFSLKTHLHLSKGDIAFILSPPHLNIPVLYLSLLNIGVIVSPANPVSSPQEISRQISLVNPTIIFATKNTKRIFHPDSNNNNAKLVLLDSPEFRSFLTTANKLETPVKIYQSDTAAIQFSSGTTGLVKAAALPHRSLIAMTAGFHALRETEYTSNTSVLVAPMFHSLGFFFVLKGVALGETTVVMRRVGLADILGAAERYGATEVTAAPPVVVAMRREEAAGKFDLRKMERVMSGGAPLEEHVAESFLKKFPRVELRQVCSFH